MLVNDLDGGVHLAMAFGCKVAVQDFGSAYDLQEVVV